MQREKLFGGLAILIGLFAFAILLAYHRTVDGDLWARLAAGAAFFHNHDVMRQDVFAFTPVLPQWVDHEWGAGVIYFGLLKAFGPNSLVIYKILAGCVAFLACVAAARLNGARWEIIALVVLPCSLTFLQAFVPVVRSHALTFPFFALLLLCLELIRQGKRWPVFVILPMMLVWVNGHGGFVVGIGTIAVYTAFASSARKTLLVTFLACLALTFVTPYGLEFWKYLIPALLHPRPDIPEWRPMQWWGNWSTDPFVGFRFLFVIALAVIIAGWKHASRLGLVMLVITAFFACRSRRHAPFFGLACVVYLTPYVEGLLSRKYYWDFAALGAQGILAAIVCIRFLPAAGLQPLVVPSFYPVRPVDILAASKTSGNLAVPFRWGSYAMWRLYPAIKVSVDGRYEETYPESTFVMNHDFYAKKGDDWDRLLKSDRVDFVIIEKSTVHFTPAELQERGFDIVWADDWSVLMARRVFVPKLRALAQELPACGSEPLDTRIPDAWWK